MRFVESVQKNRIAWPTQRKFDRHLWTEKAQELGEDEWDHSLFRVGLWVADTLEAIRNEVEKSTVGELSSKEFARYLFSICNQGLADGMDRSVNISPKPIPSVLIDELIHKSYDQELMGARSFSALIESAIDSSELCLRFFRRTQSFAGSRPKVALGEISRILNFGTAYHVAEFIFYQSLWLGWRVEEKDDKWLIVPPDISEAMKWDASYRRFEDLLSQFVSVTIGLWKERASLKQVWLKSTNGTPLFHLRRKNDLVQVRYRGRSKIPPDLPDIEYIHESMAQEIYYKPLLREPLPSLNGLCVLDLLKVQLLLGYIADQILRSFPKSYEFFEPEEAANRFCPIILRKTLVSSISQAICVKKEIVSSLLDALTWVPDADSSKNLWFQPLFAVETDEGAGVILALMPIIAPNIYRTVDYWLSELGLPIERRGQLFEQQVVEDLKRSAIRGRVQGNVAVSGSIKLSSEDGSSEEEFDVIILLHDLVVVGEVKCQKLPVSPVECFNYIHTLDEAASQVLRKVTWAKKNPNRIAHALRVGADKLAGKFLPIVITNHSPGVGFSFHDVPVIDLLLLKNYFARPFQASGVLTTEGFIEHKGARYYNTPEEMANVFPIFASSPPSLKPYLDLLKPTYISFPIRRDKPVLMFQFEMNTDSQIIQVDG